MRTPLIALAATLLLSPFAATQTVVHYPDAAHATYDPADPNATLGFPFYNVGAGSLGWANRIQLLCPDAFLAAQGVTDGYVTHVGFSLGGEGTYTTFELRAGTRGNPGAAQLDTDWAVNLPDQRVQVDLSGQLIQGGGTVAAPVLEWQDFELAYPFHYAAGDDLIVDVTSLLQFPGDYLQTTPTTGDVDRAYNFDYSPGDLAVSFNGNGIKVRFTIAPLEMIPYGSGCPGSNGQTPALTSLGAPQIGQPLALTVDQALANSLGLFVYGFSRTSYQGAPLPADLGGSCALRNSADVLEAAVITPAGESSTGLFFPNDPTLQGAVLYCQFAQLDTASPAIVPLTFSNGGILSVY